LAEYKAHQPSRSEKYRYDSASRLADPGYAAATSSSNKSFERGTLVSNRSEVNSGASPYEREGWRLDGVNNWNQFGSNTGGLSIGTSIESTAFNEWNLAGSTVGYAGYDDNGNAETYNNVASGGPGVYRWDAWNRLRDIEDQYSQKVAEYFYDAHNRRVRKVVAYGGVENSSEVRNGTTDFAYQGWRVLWENFVPEAMLRAPATGPTTFVYGNYLDEAWDMLETEGAEVLSHYYFLTGVNYSVMAVVDGHYATDIVEAYEYDPYGRHRVIGPGTDETYFTSDDTYDEMGAGGFLGSEGGTINNSIRYTGQRFDAESNLMYYKNRYYDPSAGRFIGRDPMGWSEGPNRYGYVGGMPTMAMDPEGYQALPMPGTTDARYWAGRTIQTVGGGPWGPVIPHPPSPPSPRLYGPWSSFLKGGIAGLFDSFDALLGVSRHHAGADCIKAKNGNKYLHCFGGCLASAQKLDGVNTNWGYIYQVGYELKTLPRYSLSILGIYDEPQYKFNPWGYIFDTFGDTVWGTAGGEIGRRLTNLTYDQQIQACLNFCRPALNVGNHGLPFPSLYHR
jgi:RHS repeat-associated protein